MSLRRNKEYTISNSSMNYACSKTRKRGGIEVERRE